MSEGARNEEADALRTFYRNHLAEDLLPFWKIAVDMERGGVYTCYSNDGKKRISTDKYTWSQGRFIWIWSRIADMCSRGLLPEDAEEYLNQAEKAVDFLRRHAMMENGNCAFLLTEDGQKKESIPGAGYDTSFYADCFVVLGFAEFARVTGRNDIAEEALGLYERIRKRLAAGQVRSEPYPIPEDMKSHSFTMIMLNISHQLLDALEAVRHPQAEEVKGQMRAYAEVIIKEFRQSDQRIAELLPAEGEPSDAVLYRHVNPGHTLESMWFVLAAADRLNRPDLQEKALPVIKQAFRLGWDLEHGGLLRFVDRDSGQPRGSKSGDPYEELILDTWDSKLWWPHSEALYTTLLAYARSGDPEFLKLYRQTRNYVFRTFPNPDRTVGEWIQIRDRDGSPMEKVVALPVKDPFHIIRNVLLILELYAPENAPENAPEREGGAAR